MAYLMKRNNVVKEVRTKADVKKLEAEGYLMLTADNLLPEDTKENINNTVAVTNKKNNAASKTDK